MKQRNRLQDLILKTIRELTSKTRKPDFASAGRADESHADAAAAG
jgi:hypothetical protein